jgi:MFS family permease
MHNYPWLFGIIMILGGPIVALYGRRFFPYVIAGIVSISFLLLSLIVCSLLGFMEATLGIAGSVCFAIAIGGLAAWFVMKTVWIAVGLLGVIGGFFLGSLIYTIVLNFVSIGALWAMITFSIVCAILGGFMSFKYSKAVVLLFTSLIGSYAFMRGFSYFLGGWPSEAVLFESLKNQEPIKGLTQYFWIYVALFMTGAIGSMIFQARNNDTHEFLTKDDAYNHSDDNF